MRPSNPSPFPQNPNHCATNRFVKLKELDELRHLVRKYPDVAMDYLSSKQMVNYLMAHRVPKDFESVEWDVPEYVTMTDIPKGG